MINFTFNLTKGLLTAFVLLFISNTSIAENADYCVLTMYASINVSLDNDCQAEITYDMVMISSGTCSPASPNDFMVVVMDANNNVIPTSPFVTIANVGQTLTVKVIHIPSGNQGWSYVTVEDGLNPFVICPDDITVACDSPTDPSVTGSPIVSDCSPTTVTYSDVTNANGCGQNAITRTWLITNDDGYSETCTQIISTESPNLSDVVFPPHLNDIQSPSLDCSSNPNTSPSNTGQPTLNGQPLSNGGACSLMQSYEDLTFELCGSTYKILRTWTVINWCTSETVTHQQIIEIKDTTGPTFACPTNLVAIMDGPNCTGSINLPSVAVTDDCSDPINVFITYGSFTLNSNGGYISNLSAGTTAITYHAIDDCGNETTCTVDVDIVDNIVPTVVCDNHTTVSLNNIGTAYVNAITFDDGSTDNCCLDFMEVKIMGEPDSSFGPFVVFDCDDIGQNLMVVLRVWDCAGNFNTCMVSVTVEDKLAPEMSCPDDVTIDCGSNLSDLDQYGAPMVTDNCSFELTYSYTENIDNCGEGVILRTWVATDPGGYSSTCTQTITVANLTPWNSNGDQIVWPSDYVTHDCNPSLEPSDLSAPYDAPILSDNGFCALVGVSHTDMVLTVSAPACFKIIRTWQVMDWCNDNTSYTHTQLLEVIDNTDPVFDSIPQDFTVGILSNDCLGTVTLPEVTASDCSSNVYVTTQSVLGTGFGPFYNVEQGVYVVTYKAIDGCGNVTTHDIEVTVADTKKPTPYCLGEVTLVLMQTGMIDIWASDFDLGSYDNCGDVQISFSADVNDTQHIFTCADVGANSLEMWVTDEAGNQEYCTVTVNIQDNSDVCPDPGNLVSINGQIVSAYDDYMANVNVNVNNGLGLSNTDNQGVFALNDLPEGGDYTVFPRLDNDYRNGVNTYDVLVIGRHILETEIMDSPFKIIAADINHSGTVTGADVLILRQLILFNIDSFPQSDSWRFIKEDYNFIDPLHPLEEDFPESVTYNNVNTDMFGVDFIGVKVGDVSGDASAQFQTPNTQFAAANIRSALPLKIEAHNKGDIYLDVDVAIDGDISLAGLQMSLGFDASYLSLLDVYPNVKLGLSKEDMNTKTMDLPLISMSFIPLQNKEYKGENIVTYRFSILKPIKDATHLLSINDRFLKAELYDNDLGVHPLLPSIIYEDNIAPDYLECIISPNPFTKDFNLNIKNNEVESAQLDIFDLNGKHIYASILDLVEGQQTIHLVNDFIKDNGIYIVRLKTNNQTINKKIIYQN